MPILKKPEKLVVDANPILSALLGGKAKRLFFEADITEFAVAGSVLEEVQAYVPKMAQKLGVGHEFLFYALGLLPLTVCAPKMYRRFLQKAKMQIAHLIHGMSIFWRLRLRWNDRYGPTIRISMTRRFKC